MALTKVGKEGITGVSNSSDANAITIDSSERVTLSKTTASTYTWDGWNASDVSGSTTNAGSAGTTVNSTFVTAANSSGTCTFTFAVTGTYLVSCTMGSNHATAYSYNRIIMNLGGTTTRYVDFNPTNNGLASVNMDFQITSTFMLIASSADQTLTVLPTYELSGSGSTSQHTARAAVAVVYCGG
tara:strand:- start:392 stop:943 length:552 start_codon:yes stop_codon:yes gene_type:complete